MTSSIETSDPGQTLVPTYDLEGLEFGEPEARRGWRRWRRWLAALVAILVVAAIAVWVLNPFGSAAATTLVTGEASTGTIVASVTLSGSVASSSVNELNFGASGTVTAVNVAVGDTVAAGQVLATIDDSSLKVQLESAQANLTAAQARLDGDEAGPSAQTIASAKDAVDQAKLQLSTAKTSLSDTKAQNDLNVQQAQAAVTAAEATLASDTATLAPDDPQLAKDQAAVDGAKATLSSAQLKATQSQHQAEAQVSSATLGVTTAQHNYDTKVAPATNAQIASDEAAVAQAQQTLTSLQQTGISIVSPIAGTVTVVNITTGQSVSGAASSSSSGPSTGTSGQIEVMDLTNLQIAGEASETDISKLKMGQDATITASALATATVVGQVCHLSIVGTQISGVTSFDVTVCLDGTNTGLLVGMSATAAVVTDRADSAVLVPSLAVKTVGGQQVVTVLGADGTTQTNVPVTIGISNGSQTQILSGLTGAETVVESVQTTTQGQGGGFPGGGGRIFGGGGFVGD